MSAVPYPDSDGIVGKDAKDVSEPWNEAIDPFNEGLLAVR